VFTLFKSNALETLGAISSTNSGVMLLISLLALPNAPHTARKQCGEKKRL
jgi:hypothetical protein